jgi:hypothetical protein
VVPRGSIRSSPEFRDTKRMSIFSVSISMSSETVSPSELTIYAGDEPTSSHAKGDRISTRLPGSKVYANSYWSMDSTVVLDTWTLEPHWPALKPILESIAAKTTNDQIGVTRSIGTNSRGMGFAFDLLPEQIELLARARCGVWIDSYAPNRDRNDRPDDYPYPGAERFPHRPP